MHGGLNAALAMGNAGDRKAHLDARQGPEDRQIVGVAEMPDPEDLACELGQTGAERDVEPLQRNRPEGVGVVPLRHDERGQRGGMVPTF